MNVLVAAIAYASELSGLQRHAFNLVHCLLSRKEVETVHLAIGPWQQKMLRDSGLESNSRLHVHVVDVRRTVLSRNLWFYRELPRLSAETGADIVHAAYPVPLWRARFHCPVVVTLHDLYPYEIVQNFGALKGWFNRAILQQCLHNADAIACVSRTTKAALERYTARGIRRKSTVIYNCVERHAVSEIYAPQDISPSEPFLLCVAQHRRNKNLLLLLRIFKRLYLCDDVPESMRLVIVGIRGPETKHIHARMCELRIESKVALLEGISEAELQWCYRNCEALVVPSSTEGFGLPVIEALLVGCRVVSSDIPVLREIADGHCSFVPLDANAEGAFTQAIAKALRGPLKQPVNLPQFSPSVVARQYVVLYQSLIASAAATEELLSPHAKRATSKVVHS